MKNKLSKFFKNFTKVDYFFASLILVVGIALFLFFIRKPVYVNIRVKVTDSEVLYTWNYPKIEYAQRFVVGDTEKDGLGRPLAKVLGVEKYNINDLQKVVYLDLSVRATYDKRSGYYFSKGKPLVYGSSIKFNFGQVVFEGIVTELPEFYRRKFYEDKVYEVTALVKGLSYEESLSGVQTPSIIEPEVMKQLKAGQRMSNSNGNVLIEITNVAVRPSVRIITNDRGGGFKADDPYYIDAILTLKVDVKVVGEEVFVLDERPLRSNMTIPLILNNISVEPVVISYKEIQS